MIILGVYLLLYYARLNNEKQIINEIEEVSATLLYFDFCCTIGIALFIPIIFELLNFHQHIVWEVGASVTKKKAGSLPSTRRLVGDWKFILVTLHNNIVVLYIAVRGVGRITTSFAKMGPNHKFK